MSEDTGTRQEKDPRFALWKENWFSSLSYFHPDALKIRQQQFFTDLDYIGLTQIEIFVN